MSEPRFKTVYCINRNKRIIEFIEKNSINKVCQYTTTVLSERYGVTKRRLRDLAKEIGCKFIKTEYITEKERLGAHYYESF